MLGSGGGCLVHSMAASGRGRKRAGRVWVVWPARALSIDVSETMSKALTLDKDAESPYISQVL